MKPKRDDEGNLSSTQKIHRFINVLQLVYMNAQEDRHNGGYVIPSDIMKKVETELDFNTSETSKKQIVEEQIKKFRKRQSYTFWSSILSSGSYPNYDEAKEILMSIHRKTDHYNSMTHVRYAMETLYLALDDHFGTNTVKIIPNRFLYAPRKSRKACEKKRKKKQPTKKNLKLSEVPF